MTILSISDESINVKTPPLLSISILALASVGPLSLKISNIIFCSKFLPSRNLSSRSNSSRFLSISDCIQALIEIGSAETIAKNSGTPIPTYTSRRLSISFFCCSTSNFLCSTESSSLRIIYLVIEFSLLPCNFSYFFSHLFLRAIVCKRSLAIVTNFVFVPNKTIRIISKTWVKEQLFLMLREIAL